jgi:hypothetical protein
MALCLLKYYACHYVGKFLRRVRNVVMKEEYLWHNFCVLEYVAKVAAKAGAWLAQF